MRTKCNNIEISMGGIIEELFESLLQKYQGELEKSIKGSDFVLESADLLLYEIHKISLNREGSYIGSPEWLKNEKATKNSKNNDNKCFQYTLTVALNYEQIKKDPQRILKIKYFIDQYNWKEMNFLSHKKDCRKFELNNKSIALNILYVPYNTKKVKWESK